MRSGARGVLLGAAAALVVLLGWLVWQGVTPPPPKPVPSPEPSAAVALPGPAGPAPAVAEAGSLAAADPAGGLRPRIDLVRVEPDGSALVAGQGEPGASLVVLVNGSEAAPARADAAGAFVTFLVLPPGEEPHVLSLRMSRADGSSVEGDEEVFVAARPAGAAEPISAPGPAVAQIAAAPSPEPEPETPAGPGASGVPPASAGPAAVPSAVAAGEDGLRVLGPVDGVVIDSLSYDDAGDIRLAGRSAGGLVRLYVDGSHAGDVPVSERGDWRLALPELGRGAHEVRADLVAPTGEVIARYEMPFVAEEPAVVAALAAGAADVAGRAVGVVTVQPGESLWRIAQGRYGAGERYVRVWEANRAQIRDPDLIYPGQVFTIPDPGD